MQWRYTLARAVASAVTLVHHPAPLARISRCDITRSPIAERGWFITLTTGDGSEIDGWIDKNHHCHLLGNHSLSRSLRRGLRATTRAFDSEGSRTGLHCSVAPGADSSRPLLVCSEIATIAKAAMTVSQDVNVQK
jgi:hypothetical protein